MSNVEINVNFGIYFRVKLTHEMTVGSLTRWKDLMFLNVDQIFFIIMHPYLNQVVHLNSRLIKTLKANFFQGQMGNLA